MNGAPEHLRKAIEAGMDLSAWKKTADPSTRLRLAQDDTRRGNVPEKNGARSGVRPWGMCQCRTVPDTLENRGFRALFPPLERVILKLREIPVEHRLK